MWDAEMFNTLKAEEAQAFISKNNKEDTQKLRLKYHGKSDLPYSILIDQIEAKKRLAKKNADWANNSKLIFPPKLNVEQSSSDATAIYKSQLQKGESFVDITGGLGVDSYFFSKHFDKGFYCELSKNLSAIALHNFNVLNADIEVYNGNGFDLLERLKNKVDLIYLDPARRIEGKRMVSLGDCEPNVLSYIDLLFEKSDSVLIKTSPLLDISKVLSELPFVKEVHVVSVNNDCKELLFKLENIFKGEATIIAVNLKKENSEKLNSTKSEGNILYADPKQYLYEPNASVMKAGLFSEIAEKYSIYKLDKNSHLFTSEELIPNFMGKTFKIIEYNSPYKKKMKGEYVNVVIRNFKQKPEQIKNKLKTKDGGARFLFATTLKDKKPVFILAERLE